MKWVPESPWKENKHWVQQMEPLGMLLASTTGKSLVDQAAGLTVAQMATVKDNLLKALFVARWIEKWMMHLVDGWVI